MKQQLVWIFACMLAMEWACADGEADTRPAEASPVASGGVEGPLISTYETAVVRAIEGVRAMAAKNPDCWFLPPDNPAKVIAYNEGKSYTRQYREIEVKTRTPIYAYESYEALVPGGTTGQMVKKTLSRIKGIKGYKEGTKTKLVPDPNGPIVRKHTKRIPVYEEGASPVWPWGRLGVNGFMLYALRAAGLPGTDALLQPTAEGLAAFVEAFEMPDSTWDLAWLTAAFAVMPGEPYDELTSRCAAKLMDGQVTAGECAGMWGPVCVNASVLSAVYKVLAELSESKVKVDAAVQAEMQAALAGKKSGKNMSKAEQEQIRLEQVMRDVQREGLRVSQFGLRLYQGVHKGKHCILTIEAHDGSTVRLPGHPYLVHNQVLTDMESTSIAIFALRVAAQQKRLPQQTWRPALASAGNWKSRAGLPPARNATDVLRLAERAVADARLPSRHWSETNLQQPVSDFAWLKTMPQIKGGLPKLDAPASALSTLRGFTALNNVACFRNMTLPPVPYDDASFMKIADEALAWNAAAKGEAELRANAERFVVAGLMSSRFPEAKQERTGTGWERVAQRVLSLQDDKTGLWGQVKHHVLWISSGLRARREALPRINERMMGEYYGQAHLVPDLTDPKSAVLRYVVHEWGVSTAGALLVLADGLGAEWTYPTDGVEHVAPEAAIP